MSRFALAACLLLPLAAPLGAQPTAQPEPRLEPPATPSADPRSEAPAGPSPSRVTIPQGAVETALGRVGIRVARTPLVARAVDPAFEGRIYQGGVFHASTSLYRQPVEPVNTVVAIVEGEERVLPLTVIGPIARTADGAPLIPEDRALRAYCDGEERRNDYLACYQDLDGDGGFETLLRASTTTRGSALGVTGVQQGRDDDAAEVGLPIAYRAGTLPGAPTYALRYDSCAADAEHVSYIVRVEVSGERDVTAGPCTALAEELGEIEPGVRRMRLDRVEIALFERDGDTLSRIIEPIPPGALLDRIGGESARVYALGERPSQFEEQLERTVAMAQRAPYAFAAPPRVVTQEGERGDIALGGPIAYGYTGRLIGGADAYGMFGARMLNGLEDGQRVYGLPLRQSTVSGYGTVLSSGPSRMYWCAPHLQRADWRAHCFVAGDVTHQVHRNNTPAFLIMRFVDQPLRSDAVRVEEGPVDFSDIAVSIRFRRWSREDLHLELEVGPADQDVEDLDMQFRRDADGSVTIPLSGGRYRFIPVGEDGYRIDVLEPATEAGSIFPDAFRTG